MAWRTLDTIDKAIQDWERRKADKETKQAINRLKRVARKVAP